MGVEEGLYGSNSSFTEAQSPEVGAVLQVTDTYDVRRTSKQSSWGPTGVEGELARRLWAYSSPRSKEHVTDCAHAFESPRLSPVLATARPNLDGGKARVRVPSLPLRKAW